MGTVHEPSAAAREYAQAYAIHYTERDLSAALHSYGRIVADHPGTPEAGYADTQMRNIASAVVPAGALTAACVALAFQELGSRLPAPPRKSA